MAGQTLAGIRLDGEPIFGGLALDLAPAELTALVADVVARWSLTQTTLGNVFAELIGARSSAVVSIYASFDSFLIQRRMLETAAAELLPKRYSEIFIAAMEIIESAAKERHRFAHWLWGVYVARVSTVEFLLLADPKKIWRLRPAQMRHARRSQIGGSRALHLSQPRLDRKQISVYRENDLREAKQKMMRAEGYARALEDLVRATPKLRLQISRALRAQSEIQKALATERPKKTERQKAAQKPPRVSRSARRAAALKRLNAKRGGGS
jgi:hypothetical protein